MFMITMIDNDDDSNNNNDDVTYNGFHQGQQVIPKPFGGLFGELSWKVINGTEENTIFIDVILVGSAEKIEKKRERKGKKEGK